jgi:glycosyltransferase involved in cell wall biosynthesis
LKLLLVSRKSGKFNNFSIESIFNNLIYQFNANSIFVDSWSSPYLSNGFLLRLKSLFLLFLKSQKSDTDIVHITGDVHFLILAVPGRLKILTVHDLMLLSGLKGLKRYLYRLFWFQLPISLASAVTTVSETTRLNLENEFPQFKQKIRVIPPIIDYHFKRSHKIFNIDCPTILLVGVSRNKNLERVLKATMGLNLHLIIVAKIDVELFPELCNQSYSVFTNLSIDALVQKYIDSDIVCCCSTEEGFGLPIIEAQIIGRAVLTSNCSSMPEVAGDGALFVDPYSVIDIRNGINRIISDHQFREKIIKAGFMNSQRFSHELVAGQYISLYKHLLYGQYE